MDIVTVATFAQPLQGQLAKLKLEAEGITCFLADENLSQMQGYMGAPMGVRLQVRAEDVSRAEEVLAEPFDEQELMRAFEEQAAHAEDDDREPQGRSETEDEEAAALPGPEPAPSRAPASCPACGSERIESSRELGFGWFALTVLFVGIPLLFKKPTFKCKRCGHSWIGN